MTKLAKTLFLAFGVLFAVFSCFQSNDNASSKTNIAEDIQGTWVIGGFRIGEGFEQLDSTQQMQIQIQLMQYQMLNIKYVFSDTKYEIFILNDSLFDYGKIAVKDSIIRFHSERLARTDSFKIVRLNGDTLEFTAAGLPPDANIVTINLVLVRHSGTNQES